MQAQIARRKEETRALRTYDYDLLHRTSSLLASPDTPSFLLPFLLLLDIAVGLGFFLDRTLDRRCTEISASLAALRSIPPPTSSLDEPSLDFAAALKFAEKSRAQIASGLAGKEEEKRAGEGDVPAEESKRTDELEMLDLLDLI